MTEFHNILTASGYWARYQEIYLSCPTDKDAWQQLENEMMDRYGISKYTSYDSFRISKSRYYQKKRRARDIIR